MLDHGNLQFQDLNIFFSPSIEPLLRPEGIGYMRGEGRMDSSSNETEY